jgi:DNA topoisomerase-6 subunit B
MAQKQREISVSEFFVKNRHLLGFDSPARALLTTVKEAFDNSLDACEEAGILPAVRIELQEITEDRFRVAVQDNGPGILKAQVPKVFGKLLYGSKFHRLRQARGQQGIGISAAGMYGQLTTGKPIVITSKTGKGRPAHHFEIVIDTARNTPTVVKDEPMDWQPEHGTRVEIELQGTYKAGRRSVDEYIEQVGIANPHAEIFYQPPKGRPVVHIERATSELPREPLEIKPHPYGVELGMLQRILQDSESRTLSSALQHEFSRVTPKVAEEIVQLAGLSPRAKPAGLKPAEIERLHLVIPKVKIFAPPTACVVPIGEDLIRKGLEREMQAEFYTSATRPPAVYRGNPFQVEVGLAYGGSLRGGSSADDEEDVLATTKETDAQEGPITLLRLANRVPLQYQQSSCATFKAAADTNWRSYGLTQPRGSLPQGPMVLLVHIASVWVPFTSESKEAVAHYDEILKEMQLALQECGRRLGTFLRRREAERHELRRRSIFEMYIGELVESLGKLTPVDRAKLQKDLLTMARQHTGDGDEDLDAIVAATKKVAKRDDELTEEERESGGAEETPEAGSRRAGGRRAGSPRKAGRKASRRKRAASPQLELLNDEEADS